MKAAVRLWELSPKVKWPAEAVGDSHLPRGVEFGDPWAGPNCLTTKSSTNRRKW